MSHVEERTFLIIILFSDDESMVAEVKESLFIPTGKFLAFDLDNHK